MTKKFFCESQDLLKACFRFLATLVLCGTQLGNYAVEIVQMTLDIWNTWISVKIGVHLSQWGENYCNYIFLATLTILETKIAITRSLVIVLTCHFLFWNRCKMVKIANFWKIVNMPKIPSEMRMYDMVKIDTIVFEIVGEGELLKPPPPPSIVSCLKYPRIG